MSTINLKTTIAEITKQHLLSNNGLLYAQNVRAVGWIGGTVPELTEEQGIVELPTSDVSNGGIVCGSALAGRRPIYVIRYQGFITYNMCSVLNYAAKSKEMWGVPCPVFVRGIGMEGGMGPVATGMHHSAVARFPGIKVFAPMNSSEWKDVWNIYMAGDDPVYCSEHRSSFNVDNTYDDHLVNKFNGHVFILIGAARSFHKYIHENNPDASILHCYKLKPFELNLDAQNILNNACRCTIIDSDYTQCGISEHIAYILQKKYGVICKCIGLEDKTAGFAPHCDNITKIG